MVYDSLHKSIIHRHWEEAAAYLATQSGKEMTKDVFKEDLPLHMACDRRAPESIILALLEANRQAASFRGKNGFFPLHIAAQRNLPPSTIVSLIRAYPEALDKVNRENNQPRDYPQRNQISKEALLRPTACWIEDVEKEDYLGRVARRRTQLRQKMVKLQCAITISKERRERTQKQFNDLEKRLHTEVEIAKKDVEKDKKLDEIEKTFRARMESINERVGVLEKELKTPYTEEEVMMKSLMKRSYMQAVQRQYEKLMKRSDEVRQDLAVIRQDLVVMKEKRKAIRHRREPSPTCRLQDISEKENRDGNKTSDDDDFGVGIREVLHTRSITEGIEIL
uniref:Uncharacterized protein n=2 Tax=Ditylum brightwellii TaxID=49249 RepID=A0A7S1ZKU2_9STRA|mmetsp:Transcript_33540/g.50009  ORF Transcript_33540/g.50009 Transcript_33540/m.50009 type:complete len:336 (+) Transcript_33540:50-1057(+)